MNSKKTENLKKSIKELLRLLIRQQRGLWSIFSSFQIFLESISKILRKPNCKFDLKTDIHHQSHSVSEVNARVASVDRFLRICLCVELSNIWFAFMFLYKLIKKLNSIRYSFSHLHIYLKGFTLKFWIGTNPWRIGGLLLTAGCVQKSGWGWHMRFVIWIVRYAEWIKSGGLIDGDPLAGEGVQLTWK